MSLNHPAKLTALSHGGGCGCKISPAVLARLLKHVPQAWCASLLSGNQTSDDAAVYRLGAERLLVATTDFFPPIVDDPRDFGRIAAANALSDIYAMGAEPALALNLLGAPVGKLKEESIEQILLGGQDICSEAGCVIAGGHSLDSAEPFYGLACFGFCTEQHVKYNSTARAGDVVILGKPLGIGVLGGALKQNRLHESAYEEMILWAAKLNSVGAPLAKLDGVHAMSDVTGFGLLGHLFEICNAANLRARLRLDEIPLLDSALAFARRGVATAAAARNLKSVHARLHLPGRDKAREALLTDPQTNGGLLIACAAEAADRVVDVFHSAGFQPACAIGFLEAAEQAAISIV